MYYYLFSTVLGDIGVAENAGYITNVWFASGSTQGIPGKMENQVKKETPLIAEAGRQIKLFLEGKLRVFSLPLAPRGTPFMRSVWDALCNIPWGTTASYTDIARIVGNVKAVRAVGLANNRNPIPVIIPCHRVIGKNGKLTGYAGGLDIKQKLLDIESTPEHHKV